MLQFTKILRSVLVHHSQWHALLETDYIVLKDYDKKYLYLSGQELLASVGTVGATENGGGNLYVDALSAKTFLFWTWLLWRRVRMTFLVWLTLRNQEWEVQRGHLRSVNFSISQRRMMFESMSTPIVEHLPQKLVSFLISILIFWARACGCTC